MNGEFIPAEQGVIPVRTHGFSYGTTDELGIKAVEGRMHTNDLHATLLALMGLILSVTEWVLFHRRVIE